MLLRAFSSPGSSSNLYSRYGCYALRTNSTGKLMKQLYKPLVLAGALSVMIVSGCSSNPNCSNSFLPSFLNSGGPTACANTSPLVGSAPPTLEIARGCNSEASSCGVSLGRASAPPAKFVAVGYGSAGNQMQYTSAQQRLMAMRAAEVDAYRKLAEQVRGFRVSGSTTVSAFAIQSDAIRSYVDAYIRGAQITNVLAIADGNFQATVELELTDQFLGCLTNISGCATRQPPINCVSSGCTSANSTHFSY
jgi:hypothetical protein